MLQFLFSTPDDDEQGPMKDASMYFHEIPDDNSCLSKYAYSIEADSVCGCSLEDTDMCTELNNEHDVDSQSNCSRSSICSLEMSWNALVDDEDEGENAGQVEVPSIVEVLDRYIKEEEPKHSPLRGRLQKQASLKQWSSFHLSSKKLNLDDSSSLADSDIYIEEEEPKHSPLRGRVQRQASLKQWSSFRLSSKKLNLDDSNSTTDLGEKEEPKRSPHRGRLQRQNSLKQWSSFRLSSKKLNLDDSSSTTDLNEKEKDEPKNAPVRGRLQRQTSLKKWGSFRLSKNKTGVDLSQFTLHKMSIQSQDKASTPMAFAA